MNRLFQNFLKFSSNNMTKVAIQSTLPFISRPSTNFATLKDKLEKRNVKKSAEEFKNEIEFLANKPTYTLVDYKQRIIDGLNKLQKGIRAKLLTGNEQTEANLMNQKKILNAFLDEELLTGRLSADSKKEISVVAQTTVIDVNILLRSYDYMKSIHTWLRSLKERNEPLPENEEELGYLFRRDRPMKKSQIKKANRQSIGSKRKMRQRVKWGPRKKL